MENIVFILLILFSIYRSSTGLICNTGTVYECVCFRKCENREADHKICEDLVNDEYLRTVYLMGTIRRNKEIDEHYIRKQLGEFLTEKCISNPEFCGGVEMNITAGRVAFVKIFVGQTEVRLNFAVSKLSNNLTLTRGNTMDVNDILTLFSMNIYSYSAILAPQVNIRHTSGNYFNPGTGYCKTEGRSTNGLSKERKDKIIGTVLIIITILVVVALIIVNCFILSGRC
jgi:hypothetical protein